MVGKKKAIIGAEGFRRGFVEMVSVRRIYCADSESINMTEFWELLSEKDEQFTEETDHALKVDVRLHSRRSDEPYEAKASVVALGGRSILLADHELWKRASRGFRDENFTLAHELTHLALGHSFNSPDVRHFRMAKTLNGDRIRPPNDEELETDVGAVVFLCGVKLLESKASAKSISEWAHCPIDQVAKVLKLLKVGTLREELLELTKRKPRVVL